MEPGDVEAPAPAAAVAEPDAALDIDLGNMCCSDPVAPEIGSLTERGLRLLAQERAQALVAGLFELPTRRADEGGRLALLPTPSTAIPREKPPPKDAPLTKWEEFRREKGLKKRKRAGRVYDEEKGEWIATHGAKRRQMDRKYDWVREVGENYQPMEEGGDAFLDDQIRRRERVKKQKMQQAANVRRASEVDRSAALSATSTKIATASMGTFDMMGGPKAMKGLGNKLKKKKKGSKKSMSDKKSKQRRRGKK